MGVDDWELGIVSNNQSDLGTPPNITMNFNKNANGYIGEFEEYKRRREELENVN